MHPQRVLVTGNVLAAKALARLKEAGLDVEFMSGPPDEQTLLSAGRGGHVAAILLRGNPPVTRRVIDAAGGLRVIAKHGSGVDSVDLDAAMAAGIVVATAGDASAPAVAELAFAMILSLRRDLSALTERVRAGHWDRGAYLGQDLSGQMLGIVGLGKIGGRLARLAIDVGMRVVAASRESRHRITDPSISFLPFDEMLGQIDILSLHCPLTAQTRGLVGAAEIARMKRGAIIVNTARGALVDEAAIAAALQTGHLAGAGFDTFIDEPPATGTPLLAAPNVILTPHIGSQTSATQERTAMEAVDNILAVLSAGITDLAAPSASANQAAYRHS